MEMRGSGADQIREREGSCCRSAFPDPDLIDHLPLLFSALLTSAESASCGLISIRPSQ
jgi:hypothetical protein